jgi:hypothetical protein
VIFSDVLSVDRHSAQTRDAYGRASALAVASTFTITASVQRPSGWRLEKVMEGHKTRDAWYIDTITELQVEDETTGVPGDIITIDGNLYLVVERVKVRTVIEHYETLAKRIEIGKQ